MYSRPEFGLWSRKMILSLKRLFAILCYKTNPLCIYMTDKLNDGSKEMSYNKMHTLKSDCEAPPGSNQPVPVLIA